MFKDCFVVNIPINMIGFFAFNEVDEMTPSEVLEAKNFIKKFDGKIVYDWEDDQTYRFVKNDVNGKTCACIRCLIRVYEKTSKNLSKNA